MVKDIIVVANDIKLYYRGFELSLERDHLDDAIHYLQQIQREVNEYLGYLSEKKERAIKEVAVRENLKAQLKEHKTHVKKLKRELKKHRFPLSQTPDESKTARKPMKIPAVFPTILKAVQITRADPERVAEEEERRGAPKILPESDAIPVVVSNAGEEIHSEEPKRSAKTVEVLSDGQDSAGAPIQYKPGKPPIAGLGSEVHLQKADREKLVKVAEVSDTMSLSQWSELLGFRRSSSAHVFLQRMSDKGLVELQNTLEGVSVQLSSKGKSALDSVEVADIK